MSDEHPNGWPGASDRESQESHRPGRAPKRQYFTIRDSALVECERAELTPAEAALQDLARDTFELLCSTTWKPRRDRTIGAIPQLGPQVCTCGRLILPEIHATLCPVCLRELKDPGCCICGKSAFDRPLVDTAFGLRCRAHLLAATPGAVDQDAVMRCRRCQAVLTDEGNDSLCFVCLDTMDQDDLEGVLDRPEHPLVTLARQRAEQALDLPERRIMIGNPHLAALQQIRPTQRPIWPRPDGQTVLPEWPADLPMAEADVVLNGSALLRVSPDGIQHVPQPTANPPRICPCCQIDFTNDDDGYARHLTI